MQREITEDRKRPWLEVHTYNHRWTASSNHKKLPQDISDLDIIAFAVVQDCNMAGSYHRIFSYTSDYQRYFDVSEISFNMPCSYRVFDLPFLDWNIGTKVVDLRTQKVYTCVQVEREYFKCLELSTI